MIFHKICIVLLCLPLNQCQSARIVQRAAGEEDEVDSDEDTRAVIAWENGRYTEDEIKVIEEKQEKTDIHGGKAKAELEIMKKQQICIDFFQDINESGEPPKITDENRHCVRSNIPKAEGRKKRSYLMKNGGVWDKCIIPYEVDYANIDPGRIDTVLKNIRIATEHYETFTGFRFVNYTGDNSIYGLSHNSRLQFLDDGSCWSWVGRDAWYSYYGLAQPISLCGGITAIHELGHALGAEHEQQNPYSFKYLGLNYDNIADDYVQWYLRRSTKQVDDTDPAYDIGSLMHYSLTTFNKNGGMTMTTFDKDWLEILESTSNYYYLFRDLQRYHQCTENGEFDPCPADLICQNDGYKSIIRGVCQCLCPPGFESKTNCSTLGYSDDIWPGEKFSLLKPKNSSCPEGFEHGRMVHWSFVPIPGSSTNYLSPGQSSTDPLLAHDVCTKTNTWRGPHKFPSGKYCILSYGDSCPPGFTDGLIQTYGAPKPAGSTEENTGVLPDGNHGQLFEYWTCCRQDAWAVYWKTFPLANPFILYPRTSARCQNVIGTKVYPMQYYSFVNDPSYTSLSVVGMNPVNTIAGAEIKIHYCYYEPFRTDCGGIIKFNAGETTETFTSPNHPNAATDGYRCMWHFESPAGTTMQLDFNDFNIPYSSYPNCDVNHDIEVKFLLPGQPGLKYCADTFKKTIWTSENYLTVIYRTPGNVGRGFNATVKVLTDNDLCYNGDGSDGSYEGPVNYAKSFDKCVPWWNVTNCPFHQFESRTIDADLTGDECRNVGVGPAPWCYTNAETCERQTCDACMLGSCYDVESNCVASLAADPSFCDSPQAQSDCMDTCGKCASHVKMSRVTCGPPSDVAGISATPPVKSTYDVGEEVTYSCPTQTSLTRSRVCTSEGTWSNLNFVCGACPSEFSVFNKRCFKWLGYDTYVKYGEAVSMCAAYGAVVIRVDTQEVQDWVYKILGYTAEEKGTDAWLGLTRDSSTGTWSWSDGSSLGSFNNWKPDEPGTQTCSSMRASDGKWLDRSCTWFTGNVVCEFIVQDADSNVADQIPNCADVAANVPNFCTAWEDYAWSNCRAYCNI